MGAVIKDSRVIVTGGANGIGFLYVQNLLLKGAKAVAILDIDVQTGKEVVEKFNAEFGQNRTAFFSTDISKADQLEVNFKKAVEHLGGLDIMINNAGFLDDSNWSTMIDLNIKGLIQGTMMAIATMGKHKNGKGGTIINVGSILSLMVEKYVPIYCATKHAVLGFTRSIAMSFEKTGVAVKMICPGTTDTFLIRNKAHRFAEFFDQEEALEWMGHHKLQDPRIVAKEVMRLIEDAPNGAIWVNTLELSTISIDIPEFQTLGTPV